MFSFNDNYIQTFHFWVNLQFNNSEP